ncbi:glycoside hydrolase family 43 protein [Daldinia caldariorum]|uniref:glycoside hydrolase family 43 protein n=1 Tax=Daldinia caldariorum TaxID=326644 RepID=UPI002008346C|nr:glycoside hydrolase family 43 protein [Daldinia caldariorum]KAI1468012.1 glycoside hydrolase family 43 protein [Daldinia caldariorum]
MRFSSLNAHVALLAVVASSAAVQASNSTYYNPVLPGWHSDPSCTQVDGTFFCVTSTFISFPGLPIYASKDLINWKLISHAWNRESQLPGISWNTTDQQQGMYAATIRHRDDQFYVICEYLGMPQGNIGVLFKSRDPFTDEAWSDPVTFHADKIDPDLFWDDDGRAYVATQGIILQEIDLDTGEVSQPPTSLWNGTGGVWPEGPHLYRKDGWYYLMIAEGGTDMDHSITIARSRRLTGPYEAYANNPILTNRGTDEYFQTVGHGDLFQDADGNWWGMALATRSGPQREIFPMGRETVLFPVTWEEGEWPVLQPVRGKMTGRALPPPNRAVPGNGPFNSDPDVYDFEEGTAISRNLVHWRVPRAGAFSVTSRGLKIVPSRNNLTGTPSSSSSASPELSGQQGLSFIGRRQTDTLFGFSVDLAFAPRHVGQEAGVTVFLTQLAHVDLGVVLLPGSSSDPTCASRHKRDGAKAQPQLALRFRAEGAGAGAGNLASPRTVGVPAEWFDGGDGGGKGSIRLFIETANATHYRLSAAAAADPEVRIGVGTASAGLVSGGSGSFVGSLVGAYATCNGAGVGVACPEGGEAYFTRWRYAGAGQYVSETEVV